MEEAMKTMPTMPKLDSESWANSKYYKGGFDPKMNKREAALILGIFFNNMQKDLLAANLLYN